MMIWRLCENGSQYSDVACESGVDALAEAHRRLDPEPYRGSHTAWVDLEVICDETGETLVNTVSIDPAAPDCDGDHEHEWQSPHELLGGLVENPGVFGHGAGVIVKEVCAHCGAYMITDTWAQRPDTGEQGLFSIEYRPADDRSKAWLESIKQPDEDIDGDYFTEYSAKP